MYFKFDYTRIFYIRALARRAVILNECNMNILFYLHSYIETRQKKEKLLVCLLCIREGH